MLIYRRVGQILPAPCVCKYSFVETRPQPFTYTSAMTFAPTKDQLARKAENIYPPALHSVYWVCTKILSHRLKAPQGSLLRLSVH